MVTVLLMTDEPCYCAGFLKLTEIQDDPGITIIDTASSFEDGIASIAAFRPNVVVFDTTMAGGSERRLASLVAQVGTAGEVLVLGASFRLSVEHAFSAGARGYLLRSATGAEIVSAIGCVARGDAYLDPHLLSVMMGPDDSRPAKTMLVSAMMASRVSEREMAVLRRTAYGYSAKEIARELAISHKSVETYKARATAKLGLDSRSDIIRYASNCGWFASIGDDLEAIGRARPN